MSFSRMRWMAVFGVAICLSTLAQRARASIIPVTFESPTYTGSASPGTAVSGQDGWGSYAGLATTGAGVSTTTPVDGSQSLFLGPGRTGVRSGTLTDSLLNPITPTSMSWLVRVDAFGTTGTGTGGVGNRFETGITPNGTALPVNIMFTNTGVINRLTGGGAAYTPVAGAGTISLSTVYRVELNNITTSGGTLGFGTYDLNVVDTSTSTSTSIASLTAEPVQAAIGTSGVSFFTQMRWTTGTSAFIDNITLVPEPSSIYLLGGSIIVAASCLFYQRSNKK
jgi:hypothetical protein